MITDDPKDYDLKIKAIFFGGYGKGKTTLIGSALMAPTILMPAIMINIEGGEIAIGSKIREVTYDEFFAEDFKPSPDKIDCIRVTKFKEFKDILADMEDNPHGYKLCAIDSLTELNYLVTRTCVKENYDKGVKGSTGESAQLADYLLSSTRMRDLIRRFRDLNMNVVMTALPDESKDEQTGLVEVKPNLTGKLKDELPGMVDIVGYFFVPKDHPDQREIQFAASPKVHSKDRTEGNKLGQSIRVGATDPTLKIIFDRINA